MRFIAITAMFFSVSAFACPDLSGKYAACISQTGNTAGSNDMVVTQTTQNKITTYTITSTDAESNESSTEVYRADGKLVSNSIKDPESGMVLVMSSLVKCAGTALSMNMKVSMNNELVADMLTNVTKAGKQLTIKMTGNNLGESVTETLICE